MGGYRPNAGEEAKLSSELCRVIPMVQNLGGLSRSALYMVHSGSTENMINRLWSMPKSIRPIQ